MQTSCFTRYFELFEDVQKLKVFDDSKTFADAIPKADPQTIDQLYKTQKHHPDFDIKAFVRAHFILPEYVGGDVLRKPDGTLVPIEEYLWNAWTILTRANIIHNECDTEIQLPSPYVVPGGRFREMFYWDSYFTALGLIVHHRYDLLFALANNYKHLVETFGYVPNGSRTYFLGRSQPPVYSLLIDLICRYVKDDYWQDHLTTIEKEYHWWMKGEHEVSENAKLHHLINIEGHLLNRYYQHVENQRPEAFRQEDDFLQGLSEDAKQKAYPELRAGAESGWDFSSRWLKDPYNIQTIHTSDYAAVDLNTLLYLTERNLAKWYSKLDQTEKAKTFSIRANKRNKAIRECLYHHDEKFFCDFIHNAGISPRLTLAGMFPLFAGIATTQEAEPILQRIEKDFLHPGGVVTTLIDAHEQWDFPNGWAPLQYITVEACYRYGAYKLGDEIKHRFCNVVEKMYDITGTVLEKYNVVDTTSKPQDGEYELQTGFGWTNGVYLWFKRK